MGHSGKEWRGTVHLNMGKNRGGIRQGINVASFVSETKKELNIFVVNLEVTKN
jgi:hypothetical protein